VEKVAVTTLNRLMSILITETERVLLASVGSFAK